MSKEMTNPNTSFIIDGAIYHAHDEALKAPHEFEKWLEREGLKMWMFVTATNSSRICFAKDEPSVIQGLPQDTTFREVTLSEAIGRDLIRFLA